MLAKKRQREVKHQAFLRKLEQCMLNNELDQQPLAVRFGVSHATISRGMKVIRARWRLDDVTELEDRRRYRIKQLERIMNEATVSWEKSKKPYTEYSCTSVPCPKCDAIGNITDKDGTPIECPICDGSGQKKEVKITKKRNCGDPSYQQTALRAHDQICKLEALYPERTTRSRMSIGVGADGSINISHEFQNAATEDLLEVMVAIENLRLSSKQPIGVAEGRNVIDIEPVKKIVEKNDLQTV